MGRYVNPGNIAFSRIAGPDYIDKTGLISLLNERIGGRNNLVCVSRPRRFGKTFAAKMLTAYYDRSCDSHALFDQFQISEAKSYEAHINKYNVISLDIAGFVSEVKSTRKPMIEVPRMMMDALQEDLRLVYPDLPHRESVKDELLSCVGLPNGKPFIFIIDEWDAVIREAENDAAAQEAYLSLLRGWFEDSVFTPKAVAAAYITGILPIKKDGKQSAIPAFHEFSIIDPDAFSPYTGFTEAEVKEISKKCGLPYEQFKKRYNGYATLRNGSIYNPYSVMQAAAAGECRSFWTNTSSSEALTKYIRLRRKGLTETIARLIVGEEVPIDTKHFQNDFKRLPTADDVLTLLIHLGYLTYDAGTGKAHIPNEEVLQEFKWFLQEDDLPVSWVQLIERSEKFPGLR